MQKTFLLILTLITGNVASAQQFRNASSEALPPIALKPSNSMDVVSGDIDGDGDLDIVIAVEFVKNIILINDGSGKFSDGSDRLPDLNADIDPKPYPYYPYHDSEDIALADFDNDGDLDIMFVSEDDQVNELYFNNGSGVFEDRSHLIPVKGISNAVEAGDFDQDGHIDIIIGNKGQNYYLKNTGGKFVDQTSTRLPAYNDITQDLEAGDIDGDGDLDLIVGNELNNYILINDGSGQFSDQTDQYLKPEHQQSGETRDVAIVDINTDGLPDVYFANVNMFQQMQPVQRMLINTGDIFNDETSARLGFTSEHSCVDANFTDLDNDGDADLILVTYTGPRMYRNSGKGNYEDITDQLLERTPSMGVDIEVADFNNDGKPDIYFGNFRGADQIFYQQ